MKNNKKTPLFEAVQSYIDKDYSRFHMPGHKGASLPIFGEIVKYDLTEVKGLDSLYEAEEAIAQSEKCFSDIYGTMESVLSAGGSSLCIQTMLAIASQFGKKIICGRNIHTSAVNAMALLALEPVWVYPKGNSGLGLGGAIEPSEIEKALEENEDAVAVYITSPDYFGIMSDIKTISKICRGHNVFLLVDDAHGACLKFLKQSEHPIDLGADMCCDSLHKTLPVFTGGALLHINNEKLCGKAKRAMSMFGTTSPSYLIMLSCDLCIDYINKFCRADIKKTIENVENIKAVALKKGFELPNGTVDKMRVTLILNGTGYNSISFREHLEKYKIEPEYISDTGVVLMVSSFNTERDINRLCSAIENAEIQKCEKRVYKIEKSTAEVGIREARFAQYESIGVEYCEGRIVAEVISPCPPGIPVVMCGEKITKDHKQMLKDYGISTINVIK